MHDAYVGDAVRQQAASGWRQKMTENQFLFDVYIPVRAQCAVAVLVNEQH